jgi:hypothetical protein
MRFMMLIKSDASSEAGLMPRQAEIAAMSKYNDELIRSGVLMSAEGLKASSHGARLRFTGGKARVIDGPFSEAKELIAGFWIVKVASKQAAIELAKKVPLEEGEVEVRQVFEVEDFPVDPSEQPEGWRQQEQALRDGQAPAPPAATSGKSLRFIGFIKADARSEAGILPTEAELSTMGAFNEEGMKAGVFITGEGLQPSAKGAKVKFRAGMPTIIDGPFAEAKELVAGFGILRVKSKQEAIEWSLRMPIREGELEVRELFSPDDVSCSLAG